MGAERDRRSSSSRGWEQRERGEAAAAAGCGSRERQEKQQQQDVGAERDRGSSSSRMWEQSERGGKQQQQDVGVDVDRSKYKNFKNRVERYQRLVGKKGTGLALLLHMPPEVESSFKSLSEKKLAGRHGVKYLLNEMDREHLGLPEAQHDLIAEDFHTCARRSGETLLAVIRRLKDTRKELKSADAEMTV